ncbi:MAG: hypothetical protein ABR498_00910 [Candidatus Dormibacteria bacterium]
MQCAYYPHSQQANDSAGLVVVIIVIAFVVVLAATLASVEGTRPRRRIPPPV